MAQEAGFPLTLEVQMGKEVKTVTGKYVMQDEHSVSLKLPNGEYKTFFATAILTMQVDKAYLPEYALLDEDKSKIALPKIARP